MTDLNDPVRWHELELKVREFHFKRSSEASRSAVDFSKLIVTNLIWINAAGLGSLPVIASFIGIGNAPWNQKFPLVMGPGIAFGCGLLAALMCALITYFNFNSIAENADHACGQEIASIRLDHPAANQNEEFKGKVASARDKSSDGVKTSQTWIKATYAASHLAGWLSLCSFLFACFKLIMISGS